MSEIKKPKVDFDNEFLFSPLQRKMLKLLEKGPILSSVLIRILKRSRSTVYDNFKRLQLDGILDKRSKPRKTPGRPFIFFYIVDEETRRRKQLEKELREKQSTKKIINEMMEKLEELK